MAHSTTYAAILASDKSAASGSYGYGGGVALMSGDFAATLANTWIGYAQGAGYNDPVFFPLLGIYAGGYAGGDLLSSSEAKSLWDTLDGIAPVLDAGSETLIQNWTGATASEWLDAAKKAAGDAVAPSLLFIGLGLVAVFFVYKHV